MTGGADEQSQCLSSRSQFAGVESVRLVGDIRVLKVKIAL
jgi:hypothetical protein